MACSTALSDKDLKVPRRGTLLFLSQTEGSWYSRRLLVLIVTADLLDSR